MTICDPEPIAQLNGRDNALLLFGVCEKTDPSVDISSHLIQKNILSSLLFSQLYRVTGSPSIFALGAEEYSSSDICVSELAVS